MVHLVPTFPPLSVLGISTSQWTLFLVLTALLLTALVLANGLFKASAAYQAAPREVSAIVDAVESSIAENESYDRDVVARLPRLGDKIRLTTLLREIQKAGDDLREDLARLLVNEGRPPTAAILRTSARLLWVTKRPALEDRLRRVDLLRVRFLVVYLGVVAAASPPATDSELASSRLGSAAAAARKDLNDGGRLKTEKLESAHTGTANDGNFTPRKPLRRLNTEAMGHIVAVTGTHHRGWAGVVQELQRSPKMLERHATIETAMARDI